MNSVTEYIKLSGCYDRMKQLRAAGFQTHGISALIGQGRIERVKPGFPASRNVVFSGE